MIAARLAICTLKMAFIYDLELYAEHVTELEKLALSA